MKVILHAPILVQPTPSQKSAKGEFEKSFDLLLDAGEKAEEIGDSSHLAENYFVREILFANNREYSEAAEWFAHAEKLYENLGKTPYAQKSRINVEKCRRAFDCR